MQHNHARLFSFLCLQILCVGVAIFACNSHQLFEVIETGVSFENQVALEPVPDLFQLARLVDEQETAVVALVDTNNTPVRHTERLLGRGRPT